MSSVNIMSVRFSSKATGPTFMSPTKILEGTSEDSQNSLADTLQSMAPLQIPSLATSETQSLPAINYYLCCLLLV